MRNKKVTVRVINIASFITDTKVIFFITSFFYIFVEIGFTMKRINQYLEIKKKKNMNYYWQDRVEFDLKCLERNAIVEMLDGAISESTKNGIKKLISDRNRLIHEDFEEVELNFLERLLLNSVFYKSLAKSKHPKIDHNKKPY